jgi:hypothetical protein
MNMRSVLLLALIGCGSPGPSSTKDGVTVDLASVTLADDCGDHGYIPPPTVVAQAGSDHQKAADTEIAAKQSVARSETACPNGEDCHHHARAARGCSQTSMQLSFKGTAPSVKIKKVELLDDTSRPIQELASRSPKKWDGNKYVAWNEQLAGDRVATSYALAAPKWEDLGGRLKAQAKKYHVRVTIAVGDSEHTVEKQSISPAVMQPDVVTSR